MLFYSLKKIMRKTGGSSKLILKALTAHAATRLPRNRFDPIYAYYNVDFSGDSFLLNPHELIKYAFKWTPKEVAQYICLASYRNYSEYKLTGNSTLNLFHSPVDENIINSNRLLRIVDERVHFYYEEQPKRRNILWQV